MESLCELRQKQHQGGKYQKGLSPYGTRGNNNTKEGETKKASPSPHVIRGNKQHQGRKDQKGLSESLCDLGQQQHQGGKYQKGLSPSVTRDNNNTKEGETLQA